jgi:hypothetical protein
MNAEFERRDMLRLLLGAAAAALAPGGAAASSSHGAYELVACFNHRESANVVGRACLAGLAEAADAESLAEAILGGWRGADSGETLAAFVRRRLDADFAHGALVRVDGWMLAETEAQLCALAALAAEAT